MRYAVPSLYRDFSHIYIEKGVEDYDDTKIILDKFPKASCISINDYKEVFNRPKQDWKAQKKVPS